MRVLDLSSSQVLLDRVRQFQFPPLPAWWVLPPGAGCAPLRATHTFSSLFPCHKTCLSLHRWDDLENNPNFQAYANYGVAGAYLTIAFIAAVRVLALLCY